MKLFSWKNVFAATTLLSTLTGSSNAEHIIEFPPERPQVSPACLPSWGYHQTCWRQFGPVEPCDHCHDGVSGTYPSGSFGVYVPQQNFDSIPMNQPWYGTTVVTPTGPISVLPQGANPSGSIHQAPPSIPQQHHEGMNFGPSGSQGPSTIPQPPGMHQPQAPLMPQPQPQPMQQPQQIPSSELPPIPSPMQSRYQAPAYQPAFQNMQAPSSHQRYGQQVNAMRHQPMTQRNTVQTDPATLAASNYSSRYGNSVSQVSRSQGLAAFPIQQPRQSELPHQSVTRSVSSRYTAPVTTASQTQQVVPVGREAAVPLITPAHRYGR
ncbi:MAG: hypothetical protein R3C20_12300 [Planctomycetaceae bacterium]